MIEMPQLIIAVIMLVALTPALLGLYVLWTEITMSDADRYERVMGRRPPKDWRP